MTIKKSKKQKKIIVEIIVIIAMVALILSAMTFSGILNLNILVGTDTTVNGYEIKGYTGTYQFPDGPQYVHDKIKGKNIFQGTSQEVVDTDYVGSWYLNGDSEKIIMTGRSLHWNAGHDYVGQPRRPSVLVGRYWWEGFYTPASGGTQKQIFWKNGYDSTFVKLAPDSAGTFNKQEFANSLYSSDYSKYLTGSNGEKTWWVPQFSASNPIPLDYTQWSNTMETKSTAFIVKGQLSGTITIKLYVEYGELCVWGFLNSNFGYHLSNGLVQEDTLILKAGIGEVDATSKNSLSGVPGYIADGTGDPYTKYVYAEGQTVTFHYKTGASGQTTGVPGIDKQWKFEIFKPGQSSPMKTELLNDNSEADIYYTIPIGSFIPGGDNGWSYKLTNGLIVQSEGKLFVVDLLNKIPGKTTISTEKMEYTIGETVIVTCKANVNPDTQVPIDRFDVWAKWDSSTGTNYAYGPAFVTTLEHTGAEYSGKFYFTPTKSGSIYIRGHAIDKDGYAGAENQPDKLIIIKDVSHYQLTIIVKDQNGAFVQNAIVTFNNVQGTTNAQGYVTLSVEGGTSTLTVTKSGYLPYSKEEIVMGAKTIYVTINAIGGGGGEPQDVTIDVMDGSTFSSITDATVTLDTETKDTNTFGEATFSNINPASHSLSVSKIGYESFSKSIEVPEDLTAGRYTVFLYVTGTGGEPEPGEDDQTYEVMIDIIDELTSEYVSDATVDVDGQTQVTDQFGSALFNLVAGDYGIIVTKEGYSLKTDSISVSGILYHPIYITSIGGGTGDGGGGTTETFAVTVSVTYSGTSISNAIVQIGSESQTTGISGQVTIYANGGYNYLSVSHPDYQFFAETITVTSDFTKNVVLTKGTVPPGEKCTVSVTVKNVKDKSLINGATVNIGGISQTTTNGLVTIEVSKGAQTIMIAKSGYNPFTSSLTINQNMAFTVELIQTTGGAGGTPGFEMLALIGAFAVALILMRWRKK